MGQGSGTPAGCTSTPQQREMHAVGFHSRKPQGPVKVSPRRQDYRKAEGFCNSEATSGGEGGKCVGRKARFGRSKLSRHLPVPVFSEKKGHEESVSPRCPKSRPVQSVPCGQRQGRSHLGSCWGSLVYGQHPRFKEDGAGLWSASHHRRAGAKHCLLGSLRMTALKAT